MFPAPAPNVTGCPCKTAQYQLLPVFTVSPLSIACKLTEKVQAAAPSVWVFKTKAVGNPQGKHQVTLPVAVNVVGAETHFQLCPGAGVWDAVTVGVLVMVAVWVMVGVGVLVAVACAVWVA